MSVPTSMDHAEATTAGTARVFVGLWPGPAVRARLAALANQWAWSPAALRVPEQRLHMTLHFLGDVPRARLDALADGLAVPLQPFELVLDRTEVWRNGTATACPSELPAMLATLQHGLAEALTRLGISPETRSFRPHVTFARRAEATQGPVGFAPVRWRVGGYTLVESQLRDTGPVYRNVRHYAAVAPAAPNDGQPVEWPSDQYQSGPIPF